jgi:hypothetical protein
MATRVEQEGFVCTWIKKDLFLNFAIIGQWLADRFYVGKKPAEMRFERAYLA